MCPKWNMSEDIKSASSSMAMMNSPRGSVAFSALDGIRKARFFLSSLLDILKGWYERKTSAREPIILHTRNLDSTPVRQERR